MHDLHGKNYIFTLSPTFQPIAEEGCVVVASKTRKNILITIQVRMTSMPKRLAGSACPQTVMHCMLTCM